MSRAMVMQSPRQARVQDVQSPEGGVLVRVDGCGVCGSDLPVWQGRPWLAYPMAPGAPGHEAWGRIAAGEDEGQRVVGFMQQAYADHVSAEPEHLLPVPDDVPDQPLPVEAVACAVNAVRRSGIQPGDDVAVVGIGFQGALLAALARARGAAVTAASRRAFACRVAQDVGAAAVQATGPADADDVLAGRDGFPIVFEATGRQESLDLATRLVQTGGRLVVAGYHQDPRTVDMQQWNWKGIDVINAHERDIGRVLEGMRQALTMLAAGDLDLRRFVTHTYPLEEAGEAFAAMERRDDGFLKGVVCP